MSSSSGTTTTATTHDNQARIYDAVDARLNVEKKDGGLSFTQKSISAINDNIISWLRAEFPDDTDFSSALSYLSMLVLSSTTSYDLYIALTRSTLLSQLVAALPLANSLNSFEHMIKTIVGLGSISMSGHDAKTLFSYITGKQAIVEGGGSETADKRDESLRRRVAVYRALIDIISDKEDKHEVCRNFFTFAPSGRSTATAIEIEPGTTFDTKWPSSYGVFIWANFDDLPVFHRGGAGGQTPYEPRLVSLTSGSEEGDGVEIFLSGPSNDLVVRLGASRTITVNYAFEIGRWYNIVVTHSAGKDILFKSSEMCVYVNGQLVTKAIVKVPSTSGTLARRSIGNGPKRVPQQTLSASQSSSQSQSQQSQSSAMKRMSSFFHIGSSSSSSSGNSSSSSSNHGGRYQSGNTGDTVGIKDTRMVDGSFKGKIASVTMTHSGTISQELGCGAVVDFSFTPKGMLEFGTCINVDCGTKGSALSNAFSTIGVGQSHSGASVSTLKGRLCPGVRAVTLRSPVDALFSAVGMGPVILLFHPETIAQFPRSVALPYAAELVDAMLRGSPVEAVREFRALDGPGLVADFLQDPSVEITEDAIAAFRRLENTLGQTAEMCFQAHSLLILNFGCWKRTSVEAQHMLAGTALTLVSSDPKFFRECTDIGKVFRALHNYSREKSAARGYSADDVAVLRSVLCRIIENLYTEAGENITIEELRPMLNFLVYSKEEDLSDVLLIFLRILQRNLNKKIFELILYEGVNVFFRFVNMHDKRLRLAGIQMIGLFLIGCDRFAGAQLQPPSAQSASGAGGSGNGGNGSNGGGSGSSGSGGGGGPGAPGSGGVGGAGLEALGGSGSALSAEASGNGALIGETRAATMLLTRFPFGSLRELIGRFDFDFETYLYLVQLFAQGYQDDIRAQPKTFTKQVAHLRSTGGTLSDEALGVIFDLTCNEVGRKDSVPFSEKMRIVNDISMAVEVSKTLQEAILGRKYWQRWFIRLLAQLYYFSDSGKGGAASTAPSGATAEASSTTTSATDAAQHENAKAREGLVRCIAVLLKAALEGNKTATGWKQVEDFVLLASMSFAPGEAAKVSADVIGKLMDHIVYLVNTTVGTQSAALTALWGNFLHVVSIAEGVVFNAHGGEVYIANSLYYNAEGNWRDAMLVLKIFYVFDKLWACDAIRAAATSAGPTPLETIQGKKRPFYVAVTRLVLAFFQEGRRLFQSSAFEDERFQLQKAGISTDCAESYRRSCRRLEQLLRWMVGLVPSSSLTSLASKSISAKDLGAFCIWVVHDIFRTLNLTSDIYDAINGELYDFVRRVASLARPHLEALIPLLRPDSTDAGRSLYPYLFAGSPPLAEFVDRWFRPYFMDPMTDNPTVKQLQFYAGEFETKLFLTPAATIISKTEAAIVAVKEVLSKADTQDFDYKEAFSKELMTFEMTLNANASRAKARRAFLSVQMRRYLDKRIKALLRHAAAPYGCGCYDYQTARKMYPKFSSNEQQEQEQSGGSGAAADSDSNLDPQLTKEPIWKVDTSLCTGMYTRPLLKVDFREKCTPRKVKSSSDENATGAAAAAAVENSKEKSGEGKDDGTAEKKDDLKDMLKVKVREKNYVTEDGWEVVGNGGEDDEDDEWEVVGKPGGAENAEADGDVIDDVDIPEGELPAVGEKVLYVVKAVRIAMLDKIPGTLCVTKTFLYFFREGDNDGSRGYKCWPLEALDRVFLRRFIVSNALEIFTAATRRGYLFEIPDMKDCTKFVRHLSSAVSDRISSISGSASSAAAAAAAGAMLQQPQPQQLGESRKFKAYISNPMRMFKKSGLTDLWVRRKISNFQYLMALNTYAGRTFNDLAQYPVFPWVLADYNSRFIDSDDTGVYRDLSKPVGALNPNRLEGFKMRYEEMKMQWEDEQAAAAEEEKKRGGKRGEGSGIDVGSIPPFLYGSHYSTLGAVTFWLTRLEPFSHVARDLQGGEFDCADRLFSGMELAWHNCLVSPSDVKELVPEFFYFPDFLRNENKYWLGRLQTGGVVDDVVLPPWAAGSPELFVQFNLEALESPYVSAHLHEWIDLIFGYKQRGKAAEAADNVFYYLTYPESIDPRSVQGDSVEAVALRTQLTYFGQCPFQLFSSPHPARAPLPEQPPLAIPTGKEISPKVIAACPYIPYASFGAGDWIGCLTRDRQLHVLSNHSAKTRLMIGAKQTYILNFTLADPVCTTEAFPTFVFGTTPDRHGLIVAKAASSSGSVVQVALDQRLFVADDEITALAITPDGSAIAVGLSSGVIQLFEIKVITLTTSNSGAAAGGSNGSGVGGGPAGSGGSGSGAGANMLSSSSGGGGTGSEVEGMVTSYPLVNVEAGPLATVKGAGQTSRITRICFMPDSPVLAAASEDDLVCIYHVRPGYFNLVSAINVRESTNGASAHVSSMEFVKSTSNLAILTGCTKSLSLYTLNGVLVETLELDSSSTKKLLVVNKREEGSEDYQLANDIFIVFDTEGATFITSKLYHLPAPRHRTRWILPKEILDMYEIVDAFIWGKQGGGHSLASIPALNYLISPQGDQQQMQQQQQMAQQQKKSGLFGGKLSGFAKFGSSSSSGKSSDPSATGFNSASAAAAGTSSLSASSSSSSSSSTASKSKKVKVVVVCRKRPMVTTTSTTIYLAFEI